MSDGRTGTGLLARWCGRAVVTCFGLAFLSAAASAAYLVHGDWKLCALAGWAAVAFVVASFLFDELDERLRQGWSRRRAT